MSDILLCKVSVINIHSMDKDDNYMIQREHNAFLTIFQQSIHKSNPAQASLSDFNVSEFQLRLGNRSGIV